MDKFKINNQIICMRKYVKQAKVRIINKLVKQSKSLQFKQGNELQLQKYKRKVEKLLLEIETIKKLNVDAVSKAALMKEKNWEDVIADKTSTVQDRAFALVANFEAVKSEVEAFHVKNPDLSALIPVLIKQWEEKALIPEKSSKHGKASAKQFKKKGKKIKQNQQLSPLKKTFNKDLNGSLPQDHSIIKKAPSESQNGSKTSKDNIVPVKPADTRTRQDSEEYAGMNTDDVPPESTEYHGNDPADSVTVEKEVVDKTDQPSRDLEERSSALRTNKQKVIARLKLEELDGKDTIPIGETSDPDEDNLHENDDSKPLGEDLKNDPFFVSGDEPLEEDSDEKMSASDSDSSQENHFGQNRRNNQANFKGRTGNVRGRFPPGSKFRGGSRQFSKSRMLPDRRRQPMNGRKPKHPGRNYTSDHSSRGLNTRNKVFSQRTMKHSVNDSKYQSKHSTNPIKQSEPSLHPSWEAKRKQKMKEMTIAPFQGTKIKFDD